MSAKSSTKWKDALLKTSLPLEYLVADKLTKKKFLISGEYSFLRKNEQNIDTEFSVDLKAFNLLKRRRNDYWAALNLLVECKYNYPGVKWIFTPHSEDSAVSTGVISVFQDLCTRQISDTGPLYDFDDPMTFCVKGIELHESDANIQSISRGLHQLRWAMPQLTSHSLQSQITTWNNEDLHIEFICPILVTTASLHVFRKGLNLAKFQNAANIEAITEQVESLIVYQEPGPQMGEYIAAIITDLHKRFPQINTRLESALQILGKADELEGLSPSWHFDYHIESATQRVLVVNFNAFEKVIDQILCLINEAGKSLKQFAVLKKDVTKRITWVEAFHN